MKNKILALILLTCFAISSRSYQMRMQSQKMVGKEMGSIWSSECDEPAVCGLRL